MKVLFITRHTVFSGPGGDTIQLKKTAEFLSALGVDVTIATEKNPDFNGYDLIHFFNLRNPQDILANVRRAKKNRIPSVLSTIWGSYYECDQKNRSGLAGFISRNIGEYKVEYLKAVARIFSNKNFSKDMIPYFVKGHWDSQKEIVDSVDILLPNSKTELIRVRKDMNAPEKDGFVVVNAVDTSVFDFQTVEVSEKFKKFEGCLLCAARVEIRKSQLDLIKAINNTPYKLVIVGKPSPNSIEYYNECKKIAGENVHFISHVEQSELAQLYKVSKAHALISWMETPGLSSLEAGVMESNILVTDRGDTEYYFGDYAIYSEPGDIKSIQRGIEKVMTMDFDSKLRDKILTEYTWEKTAEQTFNAYKKCLDKYK
ncbi:glycosyltransferase family 4 protein [Photobacterium sp. CAU 1568]|uniref:Glycosyltransferase family 4 protein n=1 Tax=Photobacterium arenosum TaxID=2774143 RepID=A0ABR9BIN3_9GAMM|nr:glycosyltransferase family 4 protein [Photobacterium arenosum]MBD8512231.1 glycosyltransferase family 4 protein [Photobacterium arenosum]